MVSRLRIRNYLFVLRLTRLDRTIVLFLLFFLFLYIGPMLLLIEHTNRKAYKWLCIVKRIVFSLRKGFQGKPSFFSSKGNPFLLFILFQCFTFGRKNNRKYVLGTPCPQNVRLGGVFFDFHLTTVCS